MSNGAEATRQPTGEFHEQNYPQCGTTHATGSHAGELYCPDCGTLLTDTRVEFTEPDWRPPAERRTGPSAAVSRVAVGTVVGAQVNQLSPRWATLNERLGATTATLRHGPRELRALGAALDAPEPVVEQSVFLFRRATDCGMLVGHSLEGVAAACIHATARTDRRPFPLGQVVDVSPVSQKKIKAAYSKLVREFELGVAPPLPREFITRFVSEAGLSQTVHRRARLLSEQLREDGIHIGQSPPGFAAAVVYRAAKECGEEITQKQLASVAYVSVITVSRQCGRIRNQSE